MSIRFVTAGRVWLLATCGAAMAQASIITFATSGPLGINEATTTTGTTYSHTEASTTSTGNYSNLSRTAPDPCTFPCMQLTPGTWEHGAATYQTSTGKGRTFASGDTSAAAFSLDPEEARATAGYIVTDTLMIDTSQAFSATLDISFSLIAAAVGASTVDDFAGAGFEYQLKITDLLTDETYVLFMEGDRSVFEGEASEVRLYQAGWDGNPPDTFFFEESMPLTQSFSVTVPLTAFPDPFSVRPFDIEISLLLNAGCQILAQPQFPGCQARIASEASSYVTFAGTYTSENGYQYLGPDAGGGTGGEVPEPATFLLIAPALAGIVYARRRGRVTRRDPVRCERR